MTNDAAVNDVDLEKHAGKAAFFFDTNEIIDKLTQESPNRNPYPPHHWDIDAFDR